MLSLQSALLTFLFAGHDTSASTLMVATRFLKQYPEALTKLRAEQVKVRLAARVGARDTMLAAAPALVRSGSAVNRGAIDSEKQYPWAVMKLQGKLDRVRHEASTYLAHTV